MHAISYSGGTLPRAIRRWQCEREIDSRRTTQANRPSCRNSMLSASHGGCRNESWYRRDLKMQRSSRAMRCQTSPSPTSRNRMSWCAITRAENVNLILRDASSSMIFTLVFTRGSVDIVLDSDVKALFDASSMKS